MLFLVNELFKQRNTSIKIIFGEAIQPEILDTTIRKDIEWAAYIKDVAFNLKNKA